MRLTEEETIKIKVLGENESNRILNALFPKIQNRLKNLVGIKIIKADNTLIKSLKEEIESIIKSEREQKIQAFKQEDYANISSLYLSITPYSISLKISLCFNGGSYEDNSYYCIYHENYKYFGEIKDTKLKELYNIEIKPSLNAEKEISKIKKCKEILKNLQAEKEKLPYFLKDFVK